MFPSLLSGTWVRRLTGRGVQSEHKIQSGKGSLHIEMDQVPKVLKPMVDEWARGGFVVSFKVRAAHPSLSFFVPCPSHPLTLPYSKLETDPTLLIPKACAALERYGHQVVIGNDLHRRKVEVVFVSRANSNSSSPASSSSASTPSSALPTTDANSSARALNGSNAEPEPTLQTQAQAGQGQGETPPPAGFEQNWLRINPHAWGGGRHALEIEEGIVRELEARHRAWIALGEE